MIESRNGAADARTDAELLQSIAAGSKAALADFYDRHQARIHAFAMKHLGSSVDAADVVHEVMLQVWRSADRFQGRSRPLTWVLGIAYHKIGDRLRRMATRRDEALSEDIPDERGDGPADATAGERNARHIQHCIDKLPSDQRQVIHLAFYEDLSQVEIARVLDCPEGTVKSRMYHARRQLKRCLAVLMGVEP